MKNKLILVLLTVTAMLSLVACNEQEEDTGINVAVEDNISTAMIESTQSSEEVQSNTEVEETTESESITEDKTKKTKEKESKADKEKTKNSIVGEYSSEKGDIYQFKDDGTFMSFLVKSGKTSYGTYDTDDKTYITLKYNKDKKKGSKKELTYQLVKTTTKDDSDNKVTVLVMTKGNKTITLIKK